jgi:hypothetical protein
MLADQVVESTQANIYGAVIAICSAITPIILIFSLYIQKTWADHSTKERADNSSKLDSIRATTVETHVLVNSQRGVILKNMAILSRQHAVMARKAATISGNRDDKAIADLAEAAAKAAEDAEALHQNQQNIVDSRYLATT